MRSSTARRRCGTGGPAAVTVLARGSWFGYLTSVSRGRCQLVVVTDLGSGGDRRLRAGDGQADRPDDGQLPRAGRSRCGRRSTYALVSSDEALSDDDTDSSSDVYLWDRATGALPAG